MITVKECYVAVCREKDEQESALKAALEQEQELKEEKVNAKIVFLKFAREVMTAEELCWKWILCRVCWGLILAKDLHL